MKRILVLTVAMLAIVLQGCSRNDGLERYQEGTHYLKVESHNGEQISEGGELIEFFWYGCPHCKKFAPLLHHWQEHNPQVNVVFIPVVWGEQGALHAKVFYLLQQQGRLQDLHSAMFELVSGFLRTDTLDDQKLKIIEFLNEHGIAPIDVVNAIEGTQFDEQVAQAVFMANHYEVSGAPTLVINQRYRILTKGFETLEELLPLADVLLKQER